MDVKLFWTMVCILAAAMAGAAQEFAPDAEHDLVRRINEERAKEGAPELELDKRMTQAARGHSQMMAERGKLSHQFDGEPALSKRLAKTGIRFDSDAENVALGADAEGAHFGLMHSPPHRENILNPRYNAVGVGVVRKGERLWVTEDFAHRVTEYSEGEAEDRIAERFTKERRSVGLSGPRRVTNPRVHELACRVASRGQLDTKLALGLPDVNSTVMYTTSEPDDLPATLKRLKNDSTLRRFSVGACFAANEQYPSGMYWVVVVTYIN